MRNLICVSVALAILTIGCTPCEESKTDVVTSMYPEAQAELERVVRGIYDDAMAVNIEGLKTAHLHSEKFTKFGPRSFERQTVEQTNNSEAAFFSSISDLKVELRDLKIDVFDDVAITTFYPHFSFVRDGEEIVGSSRQTLVFLMTESGWKIIHEHGTVNK